MFNFIKNIIQAIKELKELDEIECCGNDMCQISQEELERIGNEGFANVEKQHYRKI